MCHWKRAILCNNNDDDDDMVSPARPNGLYYILIEFDSLRASLSDSANMMASVFLR